MSVNTTNRWQKLSYSYPDCVCNVAAASFHILPRLQYDDLNIRPVTEDLLDTTVILSWFALGDPSILTVMLFGFF